MAMGNRKDKAGPASEICLLESGRASGRQILLP